MEAGMAAAGIDVDPAPRPVARSRAVAGAAQDRGHAPMVAPAGIAARSRRGSPSEQNTGHRTRGGDGMKIRELASGLLFPEGPIAMADGSVILVEIGRGTLTRVTPDGRVQVLADLGGGPNGAAIGPDGAVYVCNNGGFHFHTEADGCYRPVRQARRLLRRPHRAGGSRHRPLRAPVRHASTAMRLRGPERHRLRRRTAASTSPTSARSARPRSIAAAVHYAPATAARPARSPGR